MHTNRRQTQRLIIIGVGTALGLILASVLILLLFKGRQNVPSTASTVETTAETPSAPTVSQIEEIDVNSPTLTPDNQPTNVWELCGLAELPKDVKSWEQYDQILGVDYELSDECLTALEQHLYAVNPFTWRGHHAEFSFVDLDDPFTFARAFTDPESNLQRVIEMINNPDCLLDNGTKINWKLKDECHADALLNYAEFYHICYQHGMDAPIVVFDPPTTEMYEQHWKTSLERHWLEQRCAKFGSELAIHQSHPAQYEKLLAISDNRLPELPEATNEQERKYNDFLQSRRADPSGQHIRVYQIMTELASRLGDPAANLTSSGKPFGQLGGVLTSEPWQELRSLKTLSKERVEQALTFINLLEHLEVEFNWDWLVEHLCSVKTQNESGDQLSCRSIIYDMYTVDKVEGQRLGLVNKFEQVATKLGVYE